MRSSNKQTVLGASDRTRRRHVGNAGESAGFESRLLQRVDGNVVTSNSKAVRPSS